jgi:eukaryotic-like serine/threonine-protein kinase
MIGTTISHYRIIEKLGEGGMGVVYKAQDTNLDRFVALKFLPPHVAASTDDKARFLQEAKAVASLAHPNICTIYSVEEEGGKAFIVMEFVDGKTLKDMDQNIPLKQAVEIGTQVADGLAAAHEKGIIHRDIKPDNIMIRKDGRVQIMDFGLAKLRGVSRLTKEGTTVGTAGYMSPEQVQGHEVDHRTDIFSLGVVLYEMFAGESPFKGVHETAIIYEIVNVDPAPLSAIKPDTDPQLDAIVLECLEKEPAERYQSVAEVAKELRRFKRESSRTRVSRVTTVRGAPRAGSQQIAGNTAQHMEPRGFIDRVRGATGLWIGMSLLFLITTIVAVILFVSRTPSTNAEVIRAFIPPPDKFGFSDASGGGHLAISPDGRKIAFVAIDSAGRSTLWVRPLNANVGTMLPGTEGALYPFWSPDNRYIAFFVGGKLKKIEATGGPTFSICDIIVSRGGSWNQSGTIVLPLDQNGGIFQVSDAGGVPKQITKLDTARGEQTHRWPFFLPDGNHFLFLARTTAAGSGGELDAICVASLDGKIYKRLLAGVSNAAFASGYLLYMRENSLMAHSFDPDALELKGDPFPISESVQFNARWSIATFSVSRTGVLVHRVGSAAIIPDLVLVDPKGKMIASLGQPEIFVNARLSKDLRKIAMDLYDVKIRNSDVYLYEIGRGVNTRFTFDPAVDMNPIWSPDGNRVVFTSDRKGHQDLFGKISTGAANEEVLVESNQTKTATDWSADGKYILFQSSDPKTKNDLWVVPMTGDRKPFVFLQTEYSEMNARFSPDMKWIAYQSDESGPNQIYVRPFPGPGAKWQVSTSGGTRPSWNRNGKEIFYLNAGKIMSAEVNGSGSTFETGKVKLHFDPLSIGGTNVRDISGDGQSILIEIPRSRQSTTPLSIIVNWDAELKKKRETTNY